MDAQHDVADWRRLATSYPARLAIYGLTCLLVFQGVCVLLEARGAAWLSEENGPLELAQVVCLLFAAAAIAVAVRWSPAGKAVLLATSAAALYAAARESDLWFETVFFEDAYKTIVGLFFEDAYKTIVGLPLALLVMHVIWTERHRLVSDALWISRKPGATLFTMGGMYLCCFCQILDRELFWPTGDLQGALGYQKALVEESAELFAYLLIAFAGIEAMVAAAQDRLAWQTSDRSTLDANAGLVSRPVAANGSESNPIAA
jgi:hypothetical protein